MLTIAFWNLDQNSRAGLVGRLARQLNADIVVLAECVDQHEEMTNTLSRATGRRFFNSDPLSERVRVYAGMTPRVVRPVTLEYNERLKIHRVVFTKTDILLAAVHLPSKVNRSVFDQLQTAQVVSKLIRDRESEFGHQRTILVGDLNMNPFDAGMVASNGIHGVMTRVIAQQKSRQVDNEEFPFFYNPMWGLLGDRTPGPAGTHYCRLGIPTEYFWNTFDQVLIRPALLDAFAEDLQVISRVDGIDLLSRNGIPNRKIGSDHLPIVIRLNLS